MKNPIYGPEHLKNPKPSTLFQEIYDELRKKKAGQLIDPDEQRRGRDWSRLANQVVGAETLK